MDSSIPSSTRKRKRPGDALRERAVQKREELLAHGWSNEELQYLTHKKSLTGEQLQQYQQRILEEANKPGSSERLIAEVFGLTRKSFPKWRKKAKHFHQATPAVVPNQQTNTPEEGCSCQPCACADPCLCAFALLQSLPSPSLFPSLCVCNFACTCYGDCGCEAGPETCVHSLPTDPPGNQSLDPTHGDVERASSFLVRTYASGR